jgi:hypothetical protein
MMRVRTTGGLALALTPIALFPTAIMAQAWEPGDLLPSHFCMILTSVLDPNLLLFLLTHSQLYEPGILNMQFLNDKLLLWQGSALYW